MKKRIVCVLLTLIMLMSLVPVTASAAGRTVSESAITILKQMEGYTTNCGGKGKTFGYGTICTDKTAHTKHTEKEADVALRDALKKLDDAVNSFASKKGLALSQNKHDALVLFSFENGTAWTTGTGDFQAAVTSGKTGSDFLNAICRWNANDNDYRRMIEANMYLNGVYSSTRPSNFIRVYCYPNYEEHQLPLDGEWELFFGQMNENDYCQYYDVSGMPAPHLVPTMDNHTFTGWYTNTEYGLMQVNNLTAANHDKWLIAGWVLNNTLPDPYVSADQYMLDQPYLLTNSQLASLYVYNFNDTKMAFEADTKKTVKDFYFLDDSLRIDAECKDEAGLIWGRIEGTNYWVMVRGTGSNALYSATPAYIDVTVTVTNSHVNMRVNASTSSKKNGSFQKGQQLRIINTANGSGLLWGQVATSATDNTPVGWVALMYTNFEAVRDSQEAAKPVNNTNVIATAVITYNGYVNVRSEAGMDNQIVSALPFGTEVKLYEIKYVNGQEWGRCSTGWFCLNYASVEKRAQTTVNTSDVGFSSYVFSGSINPFFVQLFEEPKVGAQQIYTRQILDSNVTVSNLVKVGDETWGKISAGWVRVSDKDGNPLDVTLNVAKYLVSADSVTVRKSADTAAARVDTLVKNVEFNVNGTKQVVVSGDSVWGYADKVGEDNKSYNGWVNLANKYVTRNGAPSLNLDTGAVVTGPTMMATVINTNSVKVRITGATYGKQIGTLKMGTTAAVLEEKDGWYNLDVDVDGNPETGSWVSGKYLDVHQATAGGNTSNSTGTTTAGTVETGMGVIANTYSGVNVRAGAGTGFAANGKLLPGTAVEILEVVTKGAEKWGRTAQGWVSMNYVTMIANYPVAGSTTGTAAGTTNTTTGNTATTSEPAIYTGTTKAQVNVRKTTSLDADIVRTLDAGAPITMHEIVTVTEDVKTTTTTDDKGTETTTVKKTSYWARVNDGYIYAPGDHLNLDTVDEHVYTLTGSNSLNVRDNAGTTGTSVKFKLTKGDQIKVTKLQIVNGGVWGYVECDKGEGWASLAYMTKGAITIQPENNTNNNTGNGNVTGGNTSTTPNLGIGSNVGGFVTNTSGYRYTGKVIRANEVNVRAMPSTTASKTTTLSNGQALVIYETTVAENMAWGRCDAGWVYLYYVDLTPVVNGACDARVVYNDNTVVYADASGSATTGQTYAKMSVIDIYEIVGKMARTDLGWVNTDNLL